MTFRQVMVVLGTRPEAIKLAPVILKLQESPSKLKPIVCVTGQHRQMLDQVLEWFGIRPEIDLDLMQSNQSLAEFAARGLSGVGKAMEDLHPDLVMVQGDTTTAMVASLAAFYHRIPVVHVEAGLRTGDIYNPFPEEMNRRVTGLLAALHFAPTESARAALLAERVNPDTVFCIGNTVVDALRITLSRQAEIALPMPGGSQRKILVTAHRRESFGSPFEEICSALKELADRNETVEITYPVHLNPNVRDPVSRYLQGHPRIRLIEPLRYEQFVGLMSRCDLILTDSGGIQEEATVLRKPTLVMRNTTERPEAVSAGTAILVGTDRALIVSSAERILSDPAVYRQMSQATSPFGDGHAADRIVEILETRAF